MSRESFYELCSKSVGESIEIETSDGTVFQGVIAGLDGNYLYLHSIKQLFESTDMDMKDHLLVVPLASILSLSFITVYW